MSERHQSRASVVRVKGVAFNYLQFLWSGIGQIRQQQARGNFSGAMSLAGTFIPYLPDSMKEQFRERANHIIEVMNIIKAGRLKQIQEIPDLYIRGIYKNRLLQIYSNESLNKFIDDMTTQLNQLGYMENLKVVREGEAELDPDWIALYKKEKRQSKRSKKRDASPTGSID